MITLTAEIKVKGENPSPFRLGVSRLGKGLLGETIDNTEVINKRNILHSESEIRDRAEIDKPSFGIISTGGSLSFKDNIYRFLNYANVGLLTEGIEIKIFLENTIKKTKKQVGQYYTTDWDYDNDSRSVSVSFKDDLEEWQDINVYGINYDPRKPDSKTMSFFYEYLYSKTPPKYKMLPLSLLSQETQTILREISVVYPMLEEGNLWSQWQKLCESCGLYIYKDEIGQTVCKYAKGS